MGNCCLGYNSSSDNQNLMIYDQENGNIRSSVVGKEKRDSIVKDYNNSKEPQNGLKSFRSKETYQNQVSTCKREIPFNNTKEDFEYTKPTIIEEEQPQPTKKKELQSFNVKSKNKGFSKKDNNNNNNDLPENLITKFKYVFEDEPKLKRPNSKSKMKNSLKNRAAFDRCDISDLCKNSQFN